MKEVLIVNDNHHLAKALQETIEMIGYPAKIISNADSAISEIKKGLEYGIMILDKNMYAQNVGHKGGELVAKISKKENPSIPIISYSAWGESIPLENGNISGNARLVPQKLERILPRYLGSPEE